MKPVLVLTVSACLVLPGCLAAPAKVKNMAPDELSLQTQHGAAVATTVAGGEATSGLGLSKISDDGFQQALENAITSSGLFSQVVSLDDADYVLEVVITNLGQPVAGLGMSVTLTTHWTLTEQGGGQPVWQDFVSTTHRAKFTDALYAVKRLRFATEGAARMNIKEALERLSRVALP